MTEINACKLDKQTNAREAHNPALSSPSEVITVLNRTGNTHTHTHTHTHTRTKSKAILNMKRPVVKTTKPHKIIMTPGPSP